MTIMLCVAVFLIMAFLSFFSVKYRTLAKQAFLCVLRRLVLKPCQMEFSQKMKMRLVGFLGRYSPFLARLVNQYTEALAWLFVLISLTTSIYVLIALYNIVTYGTCDPGHPGSCVVPPLNQHPSPTCSDPRP